MSHVPCRSLLTANGQPGTVEGIEEEGFRREFGSTPRDRVQGVLLGDRHTACVRLPVMNTFATEVVPHEAGEEGPQEWVPDDSSQLVDHETTRVAELEPVRFYLKQIRCGPLLTRAQEADIGRRIEVGQQKILNILRSEERRVGKECRL